VAGVPSAASPEDECFPPALTTALGPDGRPTIGHAELVAADARHGGDGRDDALIRLAAGLLGVGFDDLRQRELKRRHRQMTWIAVGSALGMAVTISLTAIAWLARRDAQRRQEQGEKLVAFMLGDMREQLEKTGKIDALEKIGVETTAFFRSLNPRDLTDPLLANHAKALRLMGEVLRLQLRYPEAIDAFTAAYDRAAALSDRHPGNGDMLFERGQAEYWIGFIHLKRGELPEAVKWMTRYRDTGAALVALDPTRPDWQGELAYGHHNLAPLDIDLGRLDAARAGLLAELNILLRLVQAAPADPDLQFRLVDANSWLGTIADRSGDFREAATRFAEQVSRVETLVRTDPGRAKWKAKLADGLGLHAGVLALSGERVAALERRARAIALFDALIASETKNLTYQLSRLFLRLKEAQLVRAGGDTLPALEIIEDTRGKLEKHAAAAPTDRQLIGRLAAACRLHAELLAAAGQPGAEAAIARAIQLNESLISGGRMNDEILGESAQTFLMAGVLAARSGSRDAGLRHWRRAIDLLEPHIPESGNWQVLDPAARALALVGRTEESRVTLARLRRFGYLPLEPWPAEGETTSSVSNTKP
jgi:serine/threonine-protein kinase